MTANVKHHLNGGSMSETLFSICCFYINTSWTKAVMHKPPVAELKAARIYFKRETRCLAARPTSDAIILKHETLASIFHVWRIGCLEGSCATDMRPRRSGSLKGAPTVESSSCYRNFSKFPNTNRQAEGGGWERSSLFFFLMQQTGGRLLVQCPWTGALWHELP